VEKSYARAILSFERDSMYEPETEDIIISPRSIEGSTTYLANQLSIVPNPSTGLIE
jgi:hypothetical protein